MRLQYRFALEKLDGASLVHMTPLIWGASEERIRYALDNLRGEITVEMSILIGKKQR